MSRLEILISPLGITGEYEPFIDVSSDVLLDSLGKIKQNLESEEYRVGIYRNDSIDITLQNVTGKFSDDLNPKSIFKAQRQNAIVRVDYYNNVFDPQCGASPCGLIKPHFSKTIFEGLLIDESSSQDIADQKIKFKTLGFEKVLDEIEFPYENLTNGDLLSEAIYLALNNSRFTQFVSVDLADISPTIDMTIDDKQEFEGTTCKEALEMLLDASSSIFYIEDRKAFVTSTQETVDVKKVFYGPASDDGIQNILDIKNIKSGLNKVFNFWTWKDSAEIGKDQTSIDKYGVKKADEVDFPFITDSSKKQTILNTKATLFSNPKMTFDIHAPLNTENIILKRLDQVLVDYPTEYLAAPQSVVPIYGASRYGVDRYPIGKWALTIENTRSFLIVGIEKDSKNKEQIFKIREA